MNFIYEEGLARDYDLKRKRPWRTLESFLNQIKTQQFLLEGLILDLGCGNGRNFELFKSKYIVGIDNSLEFLKIAKERKSQNKLKPHLILSDMKSLPLRPNSINIIFSIAALHHVHGVHYRQYMVKQLNLVLKKGGFLLITVWRKYQKRFRNYFINDFSKRLLFPKFKQHQKSLGLEDFGDIFIPWKVSKLNKTYERYYHLYSRTEIMRLFSNFKLLELRKLGGPNKKDNFFAFFKKMN
jgi:alkylated DNA repair protein alkB homolog 8